MTKAFSWGTFDDPFLDELAAELRGRSVLEVFAGNGLLARRLSERGVDILATSLFRGHDGSAERMYHPVVEMGAKDAVRKHRNRDVLLMCWPTADEAAAQAALLWGEERPIVFIGEVTDLERNQLGGCASDLFFELSDVLRSFPSYVSGRSGLDRAQIREMRKGSYEAYLTRFFEPQAATRSR